MKIRIKFEKTGVMKFVGHLDTMRYFQRAIRRAGIDISYTAGFSPHPIMSFALPLGVGVESEGEYFDVKVNSTTSSREAVDRLNEQMAEGVRILSYVQLPDDAKIAMSLVEASDYVLTLRPGYSLFDGFSEQLQRFYEQEQILVVKQTKKSERQMDLKPLIFQLSFQDQSLFLTLKAGSVDNVKPELVLEAFYAYAGARMPAHAFSVRRLELYGRNQEGELIPLSDYGVTIP